MKTINYCFTHKQLEYNNVAQYSPFGLEDVSFPLQTLKEVTDSDLIYTYCPVWSHKASRTFIVRSPIEFEFSFDNNALSYALDYF